MKFPMKKDPTLEVKEPIGVSGFLVFRCDLCDGLTELGWGPRMNEPFYDPGHIVHLALSSDPRLLHQCKDGSIGVCRMVGASQEKPPGKEEETH